MELMSGGITLVKGGGLLLSHCLASCSLVSFRVFAGCCVLRDPDTELL